MKFKALVLCALSAFSVGASAEVVYTSDTEIQELWAFPATGLSADGDVVLKMTTGVAACPTGVYIDETPGSERAYSAALSAYTAKGKVKVTVYDDAIWHGSTTPFCKVRVIKLIP